MKRSLLKFFACLAAAFSFAGAAFAYDLPFTDVLPTDGYYQDLVNLYERGIISDSADGRFYPDSLMNRDDFVSIVVGVGCKNCLMPTFDDILKYTKPPFIDFQQENRNFYCVSYAKEQGIVEGYVTESNGKSTCQNGESYAQAPFCAENKITRIEAAAVLLRQAGLWNDTINGQNFERRLTLPDTPTGWYGYAQKAVDIGIVIPDAAGKIRPNEHITRKEFVRMAANIFRVNLCALRTTDGGTEVQPVIPVVPAKVSPGISSEIRVLDSNGSCSVSAPVTTFSDPKDTSYTFFGRTESVG